MSDFFRTFAGSFARKSRAGVKTNTEYWQTINTMRKFILAALIAVAALASAQGHMTFKGVEINGKAADVVRQLENKGFTRAPQENGVSLLTGTFTGQPVIVGVVTTPISKTVSRIAVTYPESGSSWTLLSNQYEGLKERLTSKYGEPDEVIEKFEIPYSPTSYPLQAFQLEKATYKARFTTENGGVTLSILQFITTPAVCLLYWDKENEAKMDAELEDEL